jgi:hypothetical protein
MGREIRRVPANWEHPKNEEGHYLNLHFDIIGSIDSIIEDMKEYKSLVAEFLKSGKVKRYDQFFEDFEELTEYLFAEEDHTYLTKFMPNGEWYQLYQNVGEGTPLSPPFETKQELVDWLSNNKDYWGNQWTREGATHIVEVGHALSGIMAGGKIYKPEEQHLIADK